MGIKKILFSPVQEKKIGVSKNSVKNLEAQIQLLSP